MTFADPDGNGYVLQTGFSGQIACRVLECTPPKRLRISWADAADPDRMAIEVTWTLQPEETGTRLFLEHSGFDPDDPTRQLARRFMNGGWRSHVLRLLVDPAGKRWPNRGVRLPLR
ncbi:SRPBCC family protein [Nocardia shimofusensis]|uniref:SRPBCC family protein n=1 Tax=Nocardia shimofusensis TaxID=228596 RepID=UPI000A66292B|nr:SRPBCC domain-containing protein [Nocardia shimofusensis]